MKTKPENAAKKLARLQDLIQMCLDLSSEVVDVDLAREVALVVEERNKLKKQVKKLTLDVILLHKRLHGR